MFKVLAKVRIFGALLLTILFFTFSNVYTANAAGTSGTKGPIGVTGKTVGTSGPVSGTSTTKLKSDIIVINAPVKKVTGATGAKGLTGATGATGPQGPEGQEGMVGPQGPEGLQGIQGIQGPVGPQGPQGVPGPPGPAGANGADGSGGSGGGAQGPQGIQGPAGTISIGSVTYADAASASITNVGTSSAAILNFVLPTINSGVGTPGAKGDKGDTGAQGPQGIQGPIGLTGATGPAGANGAPGPKGDTGAQGPKGDPGVVSLTKSTYSSDFTSSQECSNGNAVKGLKYDSNGSLSFLCDTVGSNGSDESNGNGWGNHDDIESGWGDGKASTKTTLAVAGLLGPTLATNSSCSSNQFATGLNQDASGNFGVTCAAAPSATLSSYSYSGSSISISAGSTASATLSETRFSMVIPSGILGSTITLDSRNDSCTGTDKVNGLTLSSSGVLAVSCGSVDNSPITSVSVTSANPTASPSASWSSSSKKLTLTIPIGATGATGPQGIQGPKGADGADGLTPIIAVNSTINSGSPSVSVSSSTVSGSPKYTFSFTLPAIPSGYTATTVCMNKSSGALYIKSSCSSSSETKYTMLIDTTP